MAEHSAIEWTDATWSPVRGCSMVSPGCTNCYAMRNHHRWQKRFGKLTRSSARGMVWTGEIRVFDELLHKPLSWATPRMIFVNSQSDTFHESVPEYFIARMFAYMLVARQHTFQVLTKRSDRARALLNSADFADQVDAERMEAQVVAEEYLARRGEFDVLARRTDDIRAYDPEWPLPNVWIGASVEDQKRADERIPDLLATPAAIRFLSCEPLLGPITFNRNHVRCQVHDFDGGFCLQDCGNWIRPDWAIVGGESGPGARPMHPEWARSLRDQCAAAGVPFFFKQWGEWAPGECAHAPPAGTERTASLSDGEWRFGTLTPTQSAELHRDDKPDLFRLGKKAAGRLLDGREHSEFPR
jgi:protein gp37